MVRLPSRDKKPKNHNKQVIGVAAGAALVGAIGTALFTPKSGKEVRKDIAKGGKAAVNKAEDTLKSVESKLHKDAKPSVRSAKKTVKTAAKPVKKTTANATRTTKSNVQKVTK